MVGEVRPHWSNSRRERRTGWARLSAFQVPRLVSTRGNENYSEPFDERSTAYLEAAISISLAIFRSFCVMPPASWVVNMQVTLV